MARPSTATPPPIGTLTWYKGGTGDPVVTCVYGAAAHGRRALSAMVVSGPSLTASADRSANPLRAVAWQADIEVNDLQSVFSADWRSATQSDVARYQMRPHDQFTAQPVTVSVAPDPGQEASAVYRAVVDVHWLGAGRCRSAQPAHRGHELRTTGRRDRGLPGVRHQEALTSPY